jgi:hypothetical protein
MAKESKAPKGAFLFTLASERTLIRYLFFLFPVAGDNIHERNMLRSRN